MAQQARYLFTASMDVDPDKEALFNEVYDTEHVPLLSQVPGVIAVQRLIREPCTLSIGGELREIDPEGEARYGATYEIESPAVLKSPEWAAAVEQGRWPSEVRPYTHNRRHVLYRIMAGDS
ncbi:MAG: hypothetical protein CMK60_08815 [Proteobacteria bacterium]|jgi:hypothetical protein|uniref:YCII-related domain-containing protein n=1 Tax=marine metagenome TaxID=408172 RepID=A0A382DJP6_9ZZZZ|nr:hypothetical protein [Pseudomonadota bacterium]MBP11223.1 hypothetical protein [Acidiferrobacteraceae bacterium]MDP6135845.1 hypothetical protein [Arenicellales bacterium]MDP7219783.1 hypothetical protein [Arenicellales bacterium]|tara:strand:- start:248 stop:610 length:363 start_codon:yes stop_codon:yes gene_type:complete